MSTPRLLVPLLVGVLLLVSCSSGEEPKRGPPAEAEPGTAPTNRIDIPATVRQNLGITFARVERREVERTIRVPGAFELEPLARHEYRMTLPGHVSLEVDQYQQVEAGDLLYRFRSPEWPELQHGIIEGEQTVADAAAQIEVSRARIAEAKQRLAIVKDRIENLAAAELRQADLEAQAAELEASLPRLSAELRQAETRARNAERTREHALHRASAATGIEETRLARTVDHGGEKIPAYLAIDWIEVRATESGVVEQLAVTEGAFASPPSLVLATVDPARVRFRAMGLQADLARLTESAQARIVPPASPGIPLDDGVEAKVTIGLEAHPEQRTVTLLAKHEGDRLWIRPGVSAFLEVVVDATGRPALAIPRTAVVRDGIVSVFFRRDPRNANQAIRVEADLGASDGRWVVVKSGVSLGDEVVIEGAYELKLASQQSGADQKGGHFHADGSFHGEH